MSVRINDDCEIYSTEKIILILHVFLVLQISSILEFSSTAAADKNKCPYFRALWEFIDQRSDSNFSRKTTIHINFIVCLSLYKSVVWHFNHI
jgi:hypothetical protein